MAVPSHATGLRRLVPVLVAVVLVLPSVVWIAIDRSIWPWDPSWYGEVSIDLWATLRTDPECLARRDDARLRVEAACRRLARPALRAPRGGTWSRPDRAAPVHCALPGGGRRLRIRGFAAPRERGDGHGGRAPRRSLASLRLREPRVLGGADPDGRGRMAGADPRRSCGATAGSDPCAATRRSRARHAGQGVFPRLRGSTRRWGASSRLALPRTPLARPSCPA